MFVVYILVTTLLCSNIQKCWWLGSGFDGGCCFSTGCVFGSCDVGLDSCWAKNIDLLRVKCIHLLLSFFSWL